ncbi:MAG: hypothetical protein ABSE22_20865 [Xanthobacteraceae bacterium]
MSGVPNKSGYYSVIARAVARLDDSTHRSRQALYERARASQRNNISAALTQVEIRSEREALEQAIRTVEAEAVAAEAEKAKNDSKIISDFSDFCGKTATSPVCFYDASILPHPKEAIISAIEREIVRSSLKAHVEWLQSSVQFLMNFLEGVGPRPLPFDGGPTQRAASEALKGDSPVDELRRIMASSEYKRDMERLSRFMATAEREGEELEERIANALRARIARLTGLSQAEKAALDKQERKFQEFSKNSRR